MRIELFNVELPLFGAVGDVGEKCGVSRAEVNDTRAYKNGIIFVVAGELIPQCLLVLDVRYNGGGLVTAVVQILDDILPEGTVVYTEDKNGHRETYTSSGDTYMEYPLAVLINEDSASASEILAGAIKDYEYGTLIGTTTFGKGIVQTIFPLEDGDAVKLTTAKYFTPNGNYIHGVGIDQYI